MTDLITWLRAQLDEDAETFAALDSTALNGIDSTAGWDVRAHVERMPAEVDAKRRILDLHDRDHECSVYVWQQGVPEVDSCAWVLKSDVCSTIRLLTQPYADRPGYRDEWRPE